VLVFKCPSLFLLRVPGTPTYESASMRNVRNLIVILAIHNLGVCGRDDLHGCKGHNRITHMYRVKRSLTSVMPTLPRCACKEMHAHLLVSRGVPNEETNQQPGSYCGASRASGEVMEGKKQNHRTTPTSASMLPQRAIVERLGRFIPPIRC
jgi:hypothetical protein